uniref:Uncharacterized LOC101472562 n=1 Tax=Maylandia zebra TaxID=106582 RepID=A0A3P9BGD4_9CICH
MSSLFDHGLIRTVAVEQVVAPIAIHICRLVLLCDSFVSSVNNCLLFLFTVYTASQLGWNCVCIYYLMNSRLFTSRQIRETEDEVFHMEMSSLLESFAVCGQHVLLAAQKLSIQPSLTEHREELVTATQNVFLGIVKVLLVDDDAAVRKVIAAADQVLECLSEVGSSSDIKSLLKSFQMFSEALLAFNRLTMERANSLRDPRQTKQLLDSLDTLRRCISMLHTAMCTTIKHPTNEQAREAKRYILDKVQNTVGDITATLQSDCHGGPLRPCGYYTWKSNSLLQLLTSPSTSSIRDSSFDCLVRDLVFHCMVVANMSRRDFQQRVVFHCRHILQFWSDIKRILKSSEDSAQSFEKTCIFLLQQILMLDKTLMTTVLYQVMDILLAASSTAEQLLGHILLLDSSTKLDLNFIQSEVEDLISCTDRLIQVANFTSAMALDAKSLENVENSRACLSRLRARIAPLSLELADNSMQTAQKLREVCQKWEEETEQLQDAFSDVMDIREFTSIAVNEMVSDRHGCDTAYREQSYEQFNEHAANLIGHMKLAIHSVRRHLDRSDEPIYRNGLLVLLKQVQSSQAKVAESVRSMLNGSTLNVEAYSTFSDSVSTVIEHFKVLRSGLDGQQHPHLLSPLREGARQLEITQPCLPVKDSCELTVSDEPKLILKPLKFDLLPLLYEVVTVTKGKDVTLLNQACTSVLELSNCYAQATKEALVIVDAVDCQTLEIFRAELVSLTPLLVQTAQETAMSSAMSTESIFKHSTQFSDLINNIRKVLLPAAGTWYHTVYNELQGNLPNIPASSAQQLNEAMTLCADVVQLLTSSDLTTQSDGQETLRVLHSKLTKAQNNTRQLIEFSSAYEGQSDQLEALCILWSLSIQILLNSLDKILGTSTALNHLNPQKQLSVLSENSLRIQEATRLTSINCRSAYKSKELTRYQDELKNLTEDYLKAAEEFDLMPGVVHLAKSEFFQRKLLIKIRVLFGHLSKVNKDYDTTFQNLLTIAHFAAEHFRENNAEDISDIICRARLMLETHYICDTLSLDVQTRCWSAKAHYVMEEIRKQEGIHQEVKDAASGLCQEDNRIVQVTRKMADTVCYMTQYLKKKGPIAVMPTKEAFVSAAKDVISNCQSVTQFIRVIANHSLDKQCAVELSLIVEQILTITNQLSIISSVNAVTPGCKSSDEILVKNAQNLLQTVLRGVRAAETACIKGLKQPEPNSDGAEATALCFQWKRNLEIHRAQQTSNPDTDELGLRKTSAHPLAPSLAPQVNV